MNESAASVADYYDRNTAPFLRVGGSGFKVAAIHRQIWAPGVRTEAEAFEYLNQLILDLTGLQNLPGLPRVLDLGCGVGGTATWIAQHTSAHITGVTISVVQARLARDRAARLGLAARCDFRHGDMLHLPDLGSFDGAYAIESFIHAEDPAQFFREATRVLNSGGRLTVCDDFAVHPYPPSENAARTLALFRSGWHVRTLLPVVEVKRLAEAAQLRLIEDRDLTPHLRTVHPILIAVGGWALRLPLLRGVYWESLRGSTALQRCIREGWTHYHALVWEKR
jgi:SAM-dependent methyltransferase